MAQFNTYGAKPGGLTGIEIFIFASTTETYNCTLNNVSDYIKSHWGASSSTNNGYLSSSDWSNFNSKLSSFSETDPIFTTWLETDPLAGFLTSETDPIFSQWLIDTPPLYSETDPVFGTWLSTTPPAYPGDIPTALSELSDDSTHRLVTDVEIGTWNGKQDAGSYELSTNKDTSNGYSGLTLLAHNFWNSAKTFLTTVIGTATQVRIISLPDDDGIIALTKNIPDITDKLNLDQTSSQTITNGQPIQSTLTASELVATDANKKLQSLAVATYPNLTELSYLKGVSSALQTQIGNKEGTITGGGANQVWHGNKAFSQVVEADILLTANSTNDVSLTKHGFMPQLPGGTTTFYRADGVFAAPASVIVPNGYLQEAFAYTADTAHNIVHNFGTYPTWSAYNSSGEGIIPQTIKNIDNNTIAFTFDDSATYTIILSVGSPQLQNYTSTAIDYLATITDRIVAVTASGKTVTLPTAALSKVGYEFKIDNTSNGNITVVGQGGELIQGELSQSIPPNSCMTIYSNGIGWRFN
jgi:hypothetical protein